MKKKRNRYDGEFKLNSVKLVLNSKGERTMKAIAEDLGINYWVLVQWKKEYEEFGESAFLGKKPLSEEQDELRRLKKELETVKMERDILKKAMAIFSKNEK